MNTREINLLKNAGATGSVFPELETKLRVAAWWSLVGLLAFGIVLGTAYVVLNAQVAKMQDEKVRLTQSINAQSVKEGLLLSLEQRADLAGKALTAARPWGNLFPLLTQIGQASEFVSINVDEVGKVNVMFKLASVDDAVRVVSNIISLAQSQSLRLPQLLSFTVQNDATVAMGVSFVPNLTQSQ